MPMTLTQALQMRDAYYEAEHVIVDGTAKSYKIGNRELTRLDLDLIHKYQGYYDGLVQVLNGTKSGRSSRMGVPRDL